MLMTIGSEQGIDVFSLQVIANGVKIECLSPIAHTLHVNSVDVGLITLFLHITDALNQQVIDKYG